MRTAAQQLHERDRRENIAEGKLEGEAELLRRQPEHRFGLLPKRLRQRVIRADEAALEAWSLRLLTAATLGSIFQNPRA